MEPTSILLTKYRIQGIVGNSGNHELSVRSNMHESAETKSRVHVDSNALTSALVHAMWI